MKLTPPPPHSRSRPRSSDSRSSCADPAMVTLELRQRFSLTYHFYCSDHLHLPRLSMFHLWLIHVVFIVYYCARYVQQKQKNISTVLLYRKLTVEYTYCNRVVGQCVTWYCFYRHHLQSKGIGHVKIRVTLITLVPKFDFFLSSLTLQLPSMNCWRRRWSPAWSVQNGPPLARFAWHHEHTNLPSVAFEHSAHVVRDMQAGMNELKRIGLEGIIFEEYDW